MLHSAQVGKRLKFSKPQHSHWWTPSCASLRTRIRAGEFARIVSMKTLRTGVNAAPERSFDAKRPAVHPHRLRQRRVERVRCFLHADFANAPSRSSSPDIAGMLAA